MRWPWVSRRRLDALAELFVSTRAEMNARGEDLIAAQNVAKHLSERAALMEARVQPMQEELRALKLSAPEASQRYAEAVRRMVTASMDERPDSPGRYALTLSLDEHAPSLFGHTDNVAWAYFSEACAREVATALKQSRFLVHSYSAPVSSKA